ncbi:g3674 [Coccomyxa elongata]
MSSGTAGIFAAALQVPSGPCKLKAAPSEGPKFDSASSTRLIMGLLLQQMEADNSLQERVLAEVQLMKPLGHPLELITTLFANTMMSSPAHVLMPAFTNFSALQKVIMQRALPDALLDFRTAVTPVESSSSERLPLLASTPTYEKTPEGLSMLKSMGLLAGVTVLMATGIYPWGPIVVGLVRKQVRRSRQREDPPKAATQETNAKQSGQEPARRVWASEDASQKASRQEKNRQQAMARRQAARVSTPELPYRTTPQASPEGHQQVALGYIVFKGAQKLAHILVPQSGLSRDASRWLEDAAFPFTLTEALQEPAPQLPLETCTLGTGPQIFKPPTEAMRWLEDARFPHTATKAGQEQLQELLPEAPVARVEQWGEEEEHSAQPSEVMRWLEDAGFPVRLMQLVKEPAQKLPSEALVAEASYQEAQPEKARPPEARLTFEAAGYLGGPVHAAQQPAQKPAVTSGAMRWLEKEAGQMPVAGAVTDEKVALDQPPICEANQWLAELGEEGPLAEVKKLCKARSTKSRFFGLF